MKIAAALGVWPFKGQKIIILAGWSAEVKGRRWQKNVINDLVHARINDLVHARMNGLFFRTTGKLQEDYKSWWLNPDF